MKKFWKILTFVFLGIVISYFMAGIVISEINYKHNVKAWEEYPHNQIISHQSQLPNIKFGIGDMPGNGCGALSIYHILLMEDKYVPLPDIIREMDIYGENVFGLFGTNPLAFSYYLEKKGFEVDAHLNPEKFDEVAKESKYSVLMYFSLQWGHFQLLTNYEEATGEYQLYNVTKKQTMENLLAETNASFLRVLFTIN